METDSALEHLRHDARAIFDSALRAVDAREAVRCAVDLKGQELNICENRFDISAREIYVVAIGKAATAMTLGLADILGERIKQGIIASSSIQSRSFLDAASWQFFNGGHPLPNLDSLNAAAATFDLLRKADESRALLVFLVSGGGSAMIEWPSEELITLDDLREANQLLVTCGAGISEINTVRRTFSAVKGGRLALQAGHASQISLIVSDVNEGDESNVASGPTMAPARGAFDPREVISRYRLRDLLPKSILQAVDRSPSEDETTAHTSSRSPHCVVLDNQVALRAAAEKARQLGFVLEVAGDIRDQPIEEGGNLMLSRLSRLQEQAGQNPVCVISGGEFACPIGGDGTGGRNLETVMRWAIRIQAEQSRPHTVALSAGTDGIDGNSPAAGAVADETTTARAVNLGLDIQRLLRTSDSFTFFDQLGDAIITGSTGTNVRDVRLLLCR